MSVGSMIIQFYLQGQVQPCNHQYSERIIPKDLNNNYYMSFADILSLVLLGETILIFFILALPIVTPNV